MFFVKTKKKILFANLHYHDQIMKYETNIINSSVGYHICPDKCRKKVHKTENEISMRINIRQKCQVVEMLGGKGGFKSEDTEDFFRCQNEYSKSLS